MLLTECLGPLEPVDGSKSENSFSDDVAAVSLSDGFDDHKLPADKRVF